MTAAAGCRLIVSLLNRLAITSTGASAAVTVAVVMGGSPIVAAFMRAWHLPHNSEDAAFMLTGRLESENRSQWRYLMYENAPPP
jgi:hypothetical protein